MKATEYDIRISRAARALRELRCVKQAYVAAQVGTTESNYSKIENGYKAITVGQLKTVADSIGVSVVLIFALAEADRLVDQRLVPLSSIILDFVQLGQQNQHAFSYEDVEFVLSRIRQSPTVNVL